MESGLTTPPALIGTGPRMGVTSAENAHLQQAPLGPRHANVASEQPVAQQNGDRPRGRSVYASGDRLRCRNELSWRPCLIEPCDGFPGGHLQEIGDFAISLQDREEPDTHIGEREIGPRL